MTSNASTYASEQSWRDLQRKLKSLPEKVRRRNIHRILTREARPLVWAARKAAYSDSLKSTKGGKKKIRKSGAQWYNLSSSINVFKNKKSQDYQYVVVGTRGISKRPPGALYAQWQNMGGTRKNFKAKRFFDRAEQENGQQVSDKALRAVNKEIENILRTTFR
jgi:hypothetical protein